MNKYLLDTNVLIRYLNNDAVTIEALLARQGLLVVSVISIGELVFGAYKSRDWEKNLRNIAQMIPFFETIIVDVPLSQTYGLVKSNLKEQGITLTENDLWIASTAIHYRLTLVTRDRDFALIKGFQLRIEAW
jgi:tRNA(fMet)-specific endonuclease VapC